MKLSKNALVILSISLAAQLSFAGPVSSQVKDYTTLLTEIKKQAQTVTDINSGKVTSYYKGYPQARLTELTAEFETKFPQATGELVQALSRGGIKVRGSSNIASLIGLGVVSGAALILANKVRIVNPHEATIGNNKSSKGSLTDEANKVLGIESAQTVKGSKTSGTLSSN